MLKLASFDQNVLKVSSVNMATKHWFVYLFEVVSIHDSIREGWCGSERGLRVHPVALVQIVLGTDETQ